MKVENQSLFGYLENLQSQGRYWFLRKEVMRHLRMTGNAFKLAARRLFLKGKLKRVRGDFYILIPLEYRTSSSLPASWFIDAFMKYLKRSYYVGLLSAAALHGAAHQQPMVFQVITNQPMRPIVIGHVCIEFFYKKEIQTHFYQSIKTATGMMQVSIPEMTAFDLVRYMSRTGQISHIATVINELAEKMEPERLSQFVKDSQVPVTVAQRLGYLLDRLNLNINLASLEKALKSKRSIQRLLVTGKARRKSKCVHRWNILVNETVEPDEL